MLTKIEYMMLMTRGLLPSYNRARFVETRQYTFAYFAGTVFVIENKLYNKVKKYMESKMILLKSNNEFSLGMAKLIIFENKIEFKYGSEGYLIRKDSFFQHKDKFDTILNLEAEYQV